MSFLKNIKTVLRENIREYGMFIALFVIGGIFTFTTDGLFISSRNISNLFNQTGYIAVLAVGMTLVIIIQQIDLSVGFLAGFMGAIAAIALTTWNAHFGNQECCQHASQDTHSHNQRYDYKHRQVPCCKGYGCDGTHKAS